MDLVNVRRQIITKQDIEAGTNMTRFLKEGYYD